MRILFLCILSIVFVIGQLISPEDFTYVEEPTEIPTEMTEEVPVIRPAERPTAVPQTHVHSVESAAAGTADNVPTAIPNTVNNTVDPVILFGQPVVTDKFDRGSSGFGLSAGLNDDEAIRIVALNNRLSLEPKKNNGWLSWRLCPPVIADGAAEMDFSITTCARGDRVGIMMHAEDYTNGHAYYVSLACEGTLSILKDSEVLASANASAAFNNNSGDKNTLTVTIMDDLLTASLNNRPILQIREDSYTKGYSGFFTSPQEQGTLTLDINSFYVYSGEDPDGNSNGF